MKTTPVNFVQVLFISCQDPEPAKHQLEHINFNLLSSAVISIVGHESGIRERGSRPTLQLFKQVRHPSTGHLCLPFFPRTLKGLPACN